MPNIRLSRYGVLLWVSLIILPSHSSAYFLVANINQELNSLSKRDLLLIFSMRKTNWEDGSPIQLVVLPDNNYLHRNFSQQVLGINFNQLKIIWDMNGFSGKSALPLVVKDKAEMIKTLKKIKGSIGYIQSNHIPGLKVFEIKTADKS